MASIVLLFIVVVLTFSAIKCQRNHRETFIHFDLKVTFHEYFSIHLNSIESLCAPPRPSYFKQLLKLVNELGANGVLIEWEDMFPYKGSLQSIKNGNAYTVDETLDILQYANSLELSVIPLVQTVGHLEWILKTAEFASLRENDSYPMVVCVADNETRTLILDSIHQVMTLHSNIRIPYIHIGADEVTQIGQCDEDRKVLPVLYGNSTKRLLFDYIRSIATNITQSFKNTKVLMWFDELKNTDEKLIEEYELDHLVIPVVWKYTANLEEDLPARMWHELARSFSTVWGGSAFKGADGPNRIWNRMKTYVQNNKQWYLQAATYSDLFDDFHGFFLTGWQRYDHFASLCELMPVSMASLAININLVRHYAITDSEAGIIMRILKCPLETSISQLILGEDKCHFTGYKVRDTIRDFIFLKQQYDNATWIHKREEAYLQRSQIYLNASNSFYLNAVGNSYRTWINGLNTIMDQLKSAMDDLYYNDVYMEFVTDYITPFYDELKNRLVSVETIQSRRTYQARPWFSR